MSATLTAVGSLVGTGHYIRGADQHIDAVLALLNTALAPKHAYDLDQVPVLPPTEYVEVSLSRRYGGQEREDGYIGTTGYRLMTRAVSLDSMSNARRSAEKVRGALEYVSFTVGLLTTTPVEFEGEIPIAPDDGWFSGATTWIYAI